MTLLLVLVTNKHAFRGCGWTVKQETNPADVSALLVHNRAHKSLNSPLSYCCRFASVCFVDSSYDFFVVKSLNINS